MNLSSIQNRINGFSELARMHNMEMRDGYAASIIIPEGMMGTLRFTSRFGADSFRFLYTDELAKHIRWIDGSENSGLTGGDSLHLLTSGIWNFWAFNDSRERFEKILSKFFPAGRQTGTFILGATTRFSAKKKTCVVFEIRLFPQVKDACLSDLEMHPRNHN